MKKIIIIIIVVAALGFFGYTYFGDKPEISNGLVSNKNDSLKVGSELLSVLATLGTLKIDTEFFKDATFLRLRKFSRDIPTQPKGRSNPFSPVGGVTNNATSTNLE